MGNKKYVVNLKGEVHKALKSYCARHGLKIQFFVEELINKTITKSKKANVKNK